MHPQLTKERLILFTSMIQVKLSKLETLKKEIRFGHIIIQLGTAIDMVILMDQGQVQ